MVNTDILSTYYGGTIAFTKDVAVMTSSADVQNYHKGQELKITPAVLFMVASEKIPKNAFKIVLRSIDQMEDGEAVELSRLVSPPSDPNIIKLRKVHRHGQGRRYTIEVIISDKDVVEKSMVINADYDLALSEIVKPPFDAPPMITQLAIYNQVAAFKWLISKQFDVFNLLRTKTAAGRKNWGKNGY